MVSKQKQVVVMGGGVSGLVAANLLAKQTGYKVKVVEAQNQVGGLAQAWIWKPKLSDGRKVEVTYELTHAICGMQEGGSLRKTLDEIGVDWNNIGSFSAAPRFAQYITPGNSSLLTFNSTRENLNYLMATYPEEREGIQRFFNFLGRLNEQRDLKPGFRRTLEERVAPFLENTLPQPLRFLSQAALFSVTKPTFVRHSFDTFQDVLDKFFTSDEIKTSLSALYGYVGLPPSQVSGTLYALMLLSYWEDGGPQAPAEGSFQVIHDELARVLVEKYDGEVRLNTRVEKINVEGNKVTGVVIKPKKGELTQLAADCVIAAGDPQKMFASIRDQLPRKYASHIWGSEMSLSLMATHVVTDLPLHEMQDRLNYAANILASSKGAIEIENENNFPQHFVIYVNVPTLLRPDAGLIKDEKGVPRKDLHLLDIVMRSRGYDECRKLRDSDRKGEYQRFKEWHMDRMIEITEGLLIPNLSGHVLHRSMYTAATYDRFGDPTSGAVYSIAPTAKQFIPHRPGTKTPIEGLYLTGAAILAAGVGGATSAAVMTTTQVLRDLERLGL